MKVPPALFATGWLVLLAVLCNAGAQLLLKRAAPAALLPLTQWFDPRLLTAVLLYGVSFFVTALVYARLPLSLASPLMAGAIFLLIGLGSIVLLGETLGPLRLSGMLLVVLGIALLARDM
jgi:multidrug transporter EmrE-like cation transporter